MAKPGPSTRNQTIIPILNIQPADIPRTQLPWRIDVLRCFLKKQRDGTGSAGKSPSIRSIAKAVLDDIMEIWDRSSVVQWHPKQDRTGNVEMNEENGTCIMERTNVITEYRMLLKIEAIYNDALKMRKRRTQQQLKDGLFDVLSCQCDLGANSCNSCPANKRVPSEEVLFVNDQRTDRVLHIGSSVDKEVTGKRRQREERAAREAVIHQQKKKEERGTSSLLRAP